MSRRWPPRLTRRCTVTGNLRTWELKYACRPIVFRDDHRDATPRHHQAAVYRKLNVGSHPARPCHEQRVGRLCFWIEYAKLFKNKASVVRLTPLISLEFEYSMIGTTFSSMMPLFCPPRPTFNGQLILPPACGAERCCNLPDTASTANQRICFK